MEQISKDNAQYVEAQHCPYELIEDRGEAIRKAIMTSEGKTILLASHNREDIAALCDTTVEIDRGKIVE